MININESKLSIIKIDTFDKGDTTITGIDKTKLRYQVVLLTSPDTEQTAVLPVLGGGLVQIPRSCRQFKEAWIMETGTTKWKKEKYDGIAKDVMMKWMKALYPSRLDTAELLCHAIGYGNLLNEFYSTYGTEMIRDFYKHIDSIIDGAEHGTKSVKKYAKQYVASKYSCYDLLRDIIEAKDVQIYTDSDLLGKYRRISRGTLTGASLIPDRWCKAIGIVGNRTRANLSISYDSNVTVEIPENTFGIPAGPKELTSTRSFCIIKDGVLWSRRLGIKTKNQTLLRKLRNSGVIEMGLVYDDEYLLDLSRIPVISCSKTRHISSYTMASAELKVEYSRMGYLFSLYKERAERLGIKAEKTPAAKPTPEEQFLHGLGIYGDKYIPPKTTAAAVESTYESIEIVGNLSGFLKDPAGQIIKYINTGKSDYEYVNEILKSVEEKHTKSGRTWAEEIKFWDNENGKRIKILRDLKFRFILGKTLKFSDNPNKVENVRVEVHLGGKKYAVVTWDVKKSKFEV